MASTTRQFANAFTKASRTSTTSALRNATQTSRHNTARRFFQTSRRQYSSQQSQRLLESSAGKYGAITLASALFGTGVYYITASQQTQSQLTPESLKSSSKSTQSPTATQPFTPTHADYQRVYDTIATKLWDLDDYDDGSFGPVLLRLAWHSSGTYDAATKTGGSNGATMRFKPEASHGANNGLVLARDFLEPIAQQFPWISHGDLWTLAGVCAVQEMQGPVVPWRPGRNDMEESACTPDGRLPDGSKGADHIRWIFGRMGFNDREMVALSGAHAVGRCHRDRSGFEGPWTFSPTVFTNDFFVLLLGESWAEKKWDGPRQLEDSTTKSLMMLPTDYALVEDGVFRKVVEEYAQDQTRFFADFSNVLVKLFELGVPFKQEERFTFKSTLEKEAEAEAQQKASEQLQGSGSTGLGGVLGTPQGAAA